MIQINAGVFIVIYVLAAAMMFVGVLLAVLVSLQLRKVFQVMRRYEKPRFRIACSVALFLVNTVIVYLLSFEFLIGVFINRLDATVAGIFYGNMWSRIIVSLVLSFVLVPAIMGDLVLGGKDEPPSQV